MDCRTLGFSVLHYLLEFAQIQVHWVGDAIQPSHPLHSLLLPSVFPSIRGFSSESPLHIKWPKYWNISFSISPSNEYSGWFFLGLTGLIKGRSRAFSSTTAWKHQFFASMPDLKACCTNHSTLPALNVPLRPLTFPLAAPRCQPVFLPVSHTSWNLTSSSLKPSQMDQRGVEALLLMWESRGHSSVSLGLTLCKHWTSCAQVDPGCLCRAYPPPACQRHQSVWDASVLWKN